MAMARFTSRPRSAVVYFIAFVSMVMLLGIMAIPHAPGHAQRANRSRTTAGSIPGRVVHIAVIRTGSGISASTARELRALLQLAFLEKFSGTYRLLLDRDAALVLNQGRTYLNGDCSTRACLARMLRVLKCDGIIHGDARREGAKLRLAMRHVAAGPGDKAVVRAKVNFAFPEKRANHYIRETTMALMSPGHSMNMNPGPAFEEGVEIRSPEVSAATRVDTSIFRFKSLNPVIAGRLSSWKDQVERADRACEEGDCRRAINSYRRLMNRIQAVVPAGQFDQIRPFFVELERHLAAAYVRWFVQRLRETDRVVWGNRISDLNRALNRYRRLESDMLAVEPRYRAGIGPVRTAIAERVKLVPLVVSRTFERLGDGAYRAYRFQEALNYFARGIAAASVIKGTRGDDRIRQLRERSELIGAVRRQYVNNRIYVLLAALPDLRSRADRFRARRAVRRARDILRVEGAESPEIVSALNRAAPRFGLPVRTAHTLNIESDVPDARVIMNGRPLGRLPLTRTLLQGYYRIRVESKGYRTRSFSYKHKKDNTLTIRLRR